jgi:hypothetical protein
MSETRKRIEIGETAATITCEDEFQQAAVDGIVAARSELESYAIDSPDFLLTLEPVEAKRGAPLTVRRMCSAGEKAGVGPMAAVAGAIAWAGAEAAAKAGAKHCIIDNGGDVALLLEHPVTVGILSQIESASLPAMKIEPTGGRILGLCTSSGIYGHSISFGRAQAATVMAEEPAIADAVATRLGNLCRDAGSIKIALENIGSIDGIIWAMAIVDGEVGTFGKMPELFPAKRKAGDVTVHSGFPARLPVGGS